MKKILMITCYFVLMSLCMYGVMEVESKALRMIVLLGASIVTCVYTLLYYEEINKKS